MWLVVVAGLAVVAWAFFSHARSAPPAGLGVERVTAGRGRRAARTRVRTQAGFSVRRANDLGSAAAQWLGEPKQLTGDGRFDDSLRVISVRSDVHRVFGANEPLRDALLHFAAQHPNLQSMHFGGGSLTVTFRSAMGRLSSDAVREEYVAVAALPQVFDAALALLPPQTAAQRRLERAQSATVVLAPLLFVALVAAGVVLRAEVAVDGVPFGWRLVVCLSIVVPGVAIAFMVSRDGRARVRGILASAGCAGMAMLIGGPEALEGFNSSRVTRESSTQVVFGSLREVHRSKGGNRYWLRVDGHDLELSNSRFAALSKRRWEPGQDVTLVMREGRLGMRWVERIEPARTSSD